MEHGDEVELSLVESEVEEECEAERASEGTAERAGTIELELPDALQDLLRRLSGSLRADDEAVTELPVFRDRKYGDFLSRDRGTLTDLKLEVRLKVLEAIGNSKSLRNFDSWTLPFDLSAKEWETILIPMQNNLQLQEISFHSLQSAEIEEEIAPHLHNLVRHTRDLVSLAIHGGLQVRLRAKLMAEVASGLRGNVHHKLKELMVRFDSIGELRFSGDASVVMHVSDIISLAPQLSELNLGGVCRIDGDVKEALTAALKGCLNLRHVEIRGAEEGIADVLVEVYGRICPHPVLESLKLQRVQGLTVDGLALLTNSNIIHIDFDSSKLENSNPASWQTLGEGLLQPPTLCRLEITIYPEMWSEEELQMLEEGLKEIWKVSKKSPVLDIHIKLGDLTSTKDLNFLQNALKDTYLKSVEVEDCDVSLPSFKSLVESLASSTSVHQFIIRWGRNEECEGGWTHLFRCLRDNTSIVELDLRGCRDLNNEDFREFMDLLQINFTIQKVDIQDTPWARQGKDALVQEVLKVNKKLAGYFSILAEAELPFGGAKAGRVFICGAPFAGKTRLKITMMKTVNKDSKSESMASKVGTTILTKFGLRRTKGIEVELLCDDEFATISMWDFAGQEIFRALQNILFPRFNQVSIFIFVFNPFQGEGKKRTLKNNPQSAFEEELRSWLRFIVSNMRITGRILPQVFIIITHKDKLQTEFNLTLSELESTVQELQLKFKDVVDLSPNISNNSRLIYHVNAKKDTEVQSFTEKIISSMRDALRRKSPRVPKVCSELVSSVLKRPQDIKLDPLWVCDRFYNFCSTSHDLLHPFKVVDEKGKRILHAIACYMHDAGAICVTPSTLVQHDDDRKNSMKKLIVVDINWLTQNLLGQLISIGQGFEVNGGASTSQQSHNIVGQADGFINAQQLSDIIDRILVQKDVKEKVVVDKTMIKELLLELDLCYSLESSKGPRQYFMPIIFGRQQTTSKLSWSVELQEGSDHFGYRVQCQDKERTCLSPALFPRYQIHLRKQLEVSLQMIDENFRFALSHVDIRVRGCWIFVEIDESTKNHVGIMVKFSNKRTRDWAMNFVQEHIVKDFIQFCASEKGCPGMQLVVALLRTDCVKILTPRELRKESQAVLIEELKTQFQDDIEDQLQKVDNECGLGHFHHWPQVRASDSPEFGLPEGSESAETLLSSADVNDVLTAVHKNHEELWRTLGKLQAVSNRLEIACKEHPALLLSPTGEEHSSCQREQNSQFLASLVSRPSFQNRTELSVGDKLMLQGMHEMHEMQEKMMASLAQVRDDLTNFKSSLKELHFRMSEVNSRVDSITRYKISKENHKCPRRPYFSSGVSFSQKVKAKGFSAHAVRLHLMCEARHGHHFVKDQPGLELLLEKHGQFAEWMRRVSMISLNLLWVLLKIGVQVTAGLGSVVPDLSNLATGISVVISVAAVNSVLDQLKVEVEKDVILVNDPGAVEEAWCCFRDYLAPHLTPEKCASKFSLHSVRYRNSDDPYAWLCKPCISSARRNFLLE